MTAYRTINEAAAELRVSRRWLQDFLADNPTVAFKAGRRWMFTDVDFAEIAAIRRLAKRPRVPKFIRDATNRLPTEHGHTGAIYFLESGEFIKIGFSKDWRKRLRTLLTGSPGDVRVIATIIGTPAEERKLHAKFATHRAQREWFRKAPELLDFIERYGVPA